MPSACDLFLNHSAMQMLPQQEKPGDGVSLLAGEGVPG